MTITLIFLAAIMATVIGWLLKQTLNTQPWVSSPADDAVSGASLDTNTKTIALTTFLAVATSLFALFISAYTLRMEMADWSPLAEPRVLWFNTGLLVLASIAYQLTRNAAIAGRQAALKPGLAIAGIATLLFLGGQLLAWLALNASGYYANTNPANAFFYLLTAVHGLHLLGGLYVWGRTLARMRRKDIELIDVSLSVQLCAVYWHFLLFVWLALFVVMLST